MRPSSPAPMDTLDGDFRGDLERNPDGANMLLNELPKLTVLDYPVVRKIYASSIVVANNLKNVYAEQASYVGNFELGNQSRTFERLANMLEVLNPFKDD